jgi:DNA-binding response OmpR family regulator
MSLVIIAPNENVKNTLTQALSSLQGGVQAVKHPSELKATPGTIAVIAVADKANFQELNSLAKNIPVFCLTEPGLIIEEDQASDFIFLKSSPLRLGLLVNSVRSFLKSRKQKDKMKPVTMGNFILDPRANNLENKKTKKTIRLTEKEQDMLLFLYEQKGNPVTKEKLLDHVWGYAQTVETHTLETHIYRLRQKVEADPAAPEFLITNEKGYFLKL